MPRLSIDLQEGFNGEPITITINDQNVYQKKPKTRNQIGFAETIVFEGSDPILRIGVENRQSGQRGGTEIRSTGDIHVGVNLRADGTFDFSQSGEPFKYL